MIKRVGEEWPDYLASPASSKTGPTDPTGGALTGGGIGGGLLALPKTGRGHRLPAKSGKDKKDPPNFQRKAKKQNVNLVPDGEPEVSALMEKLANAESELQYQRTAMKQIKSEVNHNSHVF